MQRMKFCKNTMYSVNRLRISSCKSISPTHFAHYQAPSIIPSSSQI